jgi:TRAP-type mannitol/chloroaromatic compound transport system substrate-binding protein
MERRSFIRNTGLAGVLAAGAAPAIVHAQANIRWRLASSFPKRSTPSSVRPRSSRGR